MSADAIFCLTFVNSNRDQDASDEKLLWREGYIHTIFWFELHVVEITFRKVRWFLVTYIPTYLPR